MHQDRNTVPHQFHSGGLIEMPAPGRYEEDQLIKYNTSQRNQMLDWPSTRSSKPSPTISKHNSLNSAIWACPDPNAPNVVPTSVGIAVEAALAPPRGVGGDLSWRWASMRQKEHALVKKIPIVNKAKKEHAFFHMVFVACLFVQEITLSCERLAHPCLGTQPTARTG